MDYGIILTFMLKIIESLKEDSFLKEEKWKLKKL